jgi:UDP-N-acetylglucosamine transferase subunit ALG13
VSMIFLTVGTIVPFDRLVRAVDEMAGRGIVPGPVFAQIGETAYAPQHMEYAQLLSRQDFERHMAEADFVIAHAGVGTMIAALEWHKRLIVVPRKPGEHVGDHQLQTARRFAALGHVLVAYEVTDLPAQFARVRSFVPTPRVAQPERVVERIRRFMEAEQEGARVRIHPLVGLGGWLWAKVCGDR